MAQNITEKEESATIRKVPSKTIVDILPMKIIESIAAQTDADTVFALMSVCKAFNTKNMRAIGDKYAKDITRNSFFSLIHCVRRFVMMFNDPVVSRNFISNVLRRMKADFVDAMRAKKVNMKDYRIKEYNAMMSHLRCELGVTIEHACDIFKLLISSQALPPDPLLVPARDIIKKYFIGKQQKYIVTLEKDSHFTQCFQVAFVYEHKKLMILGKIHYSTENTPEAKESNNKHIHHIRKHIPSMKLRISENNDVTHMMCFEATPENIKGFVDMMHETHARSFFKSPERIVPFMDIYFMSASFNTWFKESFTRHVFSERIDSIHKVNRFLGKSWRTSKNKKEIFQPNYRLCQCGECLK